MTYYPRLKDLREDNDLTHKGQITIKPQGLSETEGLFHADQSDLYTQHPC